MIRLVDKEGAETGPLAARLPSFRTATLELENMRRRLGLDVISAVTFGALSEAEMKMALSTALPTELDGPELVAWAKNKVNAQEKLKNYLEEQAIYLSKPGSSPAGWVELQKANVSRGTKQSQQGTPKKGMIKGGYIFMGGDPADPKSWKKQ